MKRKELFIVGLLTVVLAFMDITGLPCALFVYIEVADVAPSCWALMLNFAVITASAFLILKSHCPDWELGLGGKGLLSGLKKYGLPALAVGLISAAAFYAGLRPLDVRPTFLKVLVEGIAYYFGVAFVEELYVRGLLLNLMEKLFAKSRNKTAIAIIGSSVIFGLGHVFGSLIHPPLVILSKVVWTISLGLYFGAVYKKTGSLWVPVLLHFAIDVCALPYCFSSTQTYPDISLYIMLPAYILLGIYSVFIIKKKS